LLSFILKVLEQLGNSIAVLSASGFGHGDVKVSVQLRRTGTLGVLGLPSTVEPRDLGSSICHALLAHSSTTR
jgi:hypothetical protein